MNIVYRELPAVPPSRSVCVFAHWDRDGVVDPYVLHYLGALQGLGLSVVFVSTADVLTVESVERLRPLCVGVYLRDNVSFDFGSYHHGLRLVRERWSLREFDRLVFTNDTLFGPFFPLREMWGTFEGADMYGASEGTEGAPHLQSFFLVFDLDVRTRRFVEDFWDRYEHVDKFTGIQRYEIGFSVAARKAGLRLKPFLSAARAREVCLRSPAGVWYPQLREVAGEVNHSIACWDVLVEAARFPFLKSRLLCNPTGFLGPWHGDATTWHDSMRVLERLMGRVGYPFELIGSFVERLGLAPGDVPDLGALSHQALRQVLQIAGLSDGDRALIVELGCETDRASERFRRDPVGEHDWYVLRMSSLLQRTRGLIEKYVEPT